MPTGNATAIPEIEIAAPRRILAALNTIPPQKAELNELRSAC